MPTDSLNRKLRKRDRHPDQSTQPPVGGIGSAPVGTVQPILHVDMTPNPDLPVRILRVYRINCDISYKGVGGGPIATGIQHKRAVFLDRAIATLERGAKVSQGMTTARRKGRLLGRPVKLSKILPELKKLLKSGLTGSEIHRRLGNRPGAPSLAWIYQQIGKLK